MPEPSRYDILIDIKARLDEIAKANAGLRQTRTEAQGASGELGQFFQQFRQGLGLGGGMLSIAGAVAIVKNTIVQTTREALAMAGAIKDGAEALTMTRRGYQVYGEIMRDAGGQQERMTQAIAETNRKLAEARTLTGAGAAAFRFFGLDPAQLEGMSVERRMEAIGRAIAGATDKQEAFRMAGVLLGSRNLPTLLNALKQLGVDGYDRLAEKIEKAGRVMSDDTVARLDRAEKAITNFKRKLTIETGENIGLLGKLGQSFDKDFGGTLWQLAKVGLPGAGIQGLRAFVDKTVPDLPDPIEAPDPAAAEAAAALQSKRLELRQLNLRLLKEELAAGDIQNKSSLTEAEKREQEIAYLERKAKLLASIADILQALPLDPTESEESRDQMIARLRAGALSAQIESGSKSLPLSDAARIGRQYGEFREGVNAEGGARLNARDGLMAGYQNWAMSLGSVGEQAAGALQSTLGTTVDGITESIMSWATGVGDVADIARSTLLTVFQTALQTLVQMGMQQLLNGTITKTVMLGIETMMDTLRTARVAKENAAEMATLPAKSAGAAASGISSFGASLAFGAAALAIIMAAMSAFADGGPVHGPGGPRDDRILARLSAGEYVVPAHIAQSPRYAGLMAELEGARQGLPGFSLGGFVRDLAVYGGIPKFMLPKAARTFLEHYNWIDGTRIHGAKDQGQGMEYVGGERRPIGSGVDRYGVAASGGAGSAAYAAGGSRSAAAMAATEARPVRYLVFSDDRNAIEHMARSPDFENVVVDITTRNRGVILEA